MRKWKGIKRDAVCCVCVFCASTCRAWIFSSFFVSSGNILQFFFRIIPIPGNFSKPSHYQCNFPALLLHTLSERVARTLNFIRLCFLTVCILPRQWCYFRCLLLSFARLPKPLLAFIYFAEMQAQKREKSPHTINLHDATKSCFVYTK